MEKREAIINRTTRETDISLKLCLDGGLSKIDTGIGFFDHMLQAFATHGGFGLEVSVKGDLNVDGHHTVEDTGIVLGCAFREALGDKRGIKRFASSYIPMDEALAFCAVDVSGRAFLACNADMPQEKIGDYDSCLTKEFLRAFSDNAGITLHIRSEYGENAHHITEAMFKALARALREAVVRNGNELPSTKGVL